MKSHYLLVAAITILLACAIPRLSSAQAMGTTGAICNAANASDQPFIRTRPYGVTNTSNVDKYVSCAFPNNTSSTAEQFFYASFQAGAVAGEAQCVAMVGSNYNGISQYSKPAVTMAAGATSEIAFEDFAAVNSYTPASLSCRLSPGVELGLIWLQP